jgi:hypothetical protein
VSLFYLPLGPWIGWLALRHGGLTTPTAANPALPHGGFVGESKSDILSHLPAAWVEPWCLVAPGSMSSRLATLQARVQASGWSLPLVLKPDEGQRGAGLKLARSWKSVERYLEVNPAAVLVQTYHPGPYEAGIFYYRIPGEEHGRVFSITDKVFPTVTGDGRSTLDLLILEHPRLCLQWKVFARRHAEILETVPAVGEVVPLAIAGNHCQGTLFRDGGHLFTPQLERALDAIVQSYDGFFFGRFDVRYASAERLKAGADFRIIELNGVTSESTNVYDPSWRLVDAYRILARQWGLAFRIGAANRQLGHRVSTIGDLVRAAREHYGRRTVDTLAD